MGCHQSMHKKPKAGGAAAQLPTLLPGGPTPAAPPRNVSTVSGQSAVVPANSRVAKHQTVLAEEKQPAEPTVSKSMMRPRYSSSYSNVSSDTEDASPISVDLVRQGRKLREQEQLQQQAAAPLQGRAGGLGTEKASQLAAPLQRRAGRSGTGITTASADSAGSAAEQHQAEEAPAEHPRLTVAIRDATKAAGIVEVGARGTVQLGRSVPGLGHLVRMDDGRAIWVKPEGLWRVVQNEAPRLPTSSKAAGAWSFCCAAPEPAGTVVIEECGR
jgi:hypothetical protein